MANKKLTVDEVRTALEQARGLKTLAADALGVTFNTIERYIKGSVMLQDTVTTARRKRTEMAKSKLDEAIMRGESWAIMFTLKNKTDPDGEFTGETNRHELTGKDGEALIPVETMKPSEIAERVVALLKIKDANSD